MDHRSAQPFRCHLIPQIILLVGVGMFTAGCYRHVVDVKGPGASSYNTYEPHFQPKEEEEIKSFFGSVFGSKDKKSDK